MRAAEWTNEILGLTDASCIQSEARRAAGVAMPKPADDATPEGSLHAAVRPAPEACLRIHGYASPQRRAVQHFIQQVYDRRFGAEVTHWAPVLVTLERDDDILAAAGYRQGEQRLFLESYLSLPIERMLSEYAGRPVARDRIVEVGHFAARRPEHARQLMVMLARHLHHLGHEWVVSTVTLELRLLLRRMGLEPAVLAQADPARLGADAIRWGNYYSHRPKVVASHIPGALRLLEGE